jgi:hypothetical protein
MNATVIINQTASRNALSLLFTLLMLTPPHWAEETKHDPNRLIQYRGPMPFLAPETWGNQVELRFELYRSPEGGSPIWSELRMVGVSSGGWVSVDLGETQPLPDAALDSPFRFLSIWHGDIEFAPRKQVASLVYAASPSEAGVSRADYLERARSAVKAAAAKAPDRDQRLDWLVDCGSYRMEKHPRDSATWLEAAATATRVGARLPTFEQWYQAYDGEMARELAAMEGHYEWVVPWVYDPAIHGRMNELYRGKPVACYYNELNPLNRYPFRLLKMEPARGQSSPLAGAAAVAENNKLEE